jgi:hypothetical protein
MNYLADRDRDEPKADRDQDEPNWELRRTITKKRKAKVVESSSSSSSSSAEEDLQMIRLSQKVSI